MDSEHRKKVNINISMDVEDIYGDRSLLNDLLADLLLFCSDHDIPCDVYVTGVRLQGNEKFFCSLSSLKGIRLGYHSNSHSFIPIPLMDSSELCTKNSMNNLEEYFFDVNTNQTVQTKIGGIQSFRNISTSSIFRCPAFCWTPYYF